jgi:hypothetical protein
LTENLSKLSRAELGKLGLMALKKMIFGAALFLGQSKPWVLFNDAVLS